jgi:hypothetical protein
MSTENQPPPLPEKVSRDGSEIWNWAGDMSRFIHTQARIKELRHEINRCGTRCGDCYLWMKSRECPREKPGTGKRSGYSVGPSCEDHICNKFVEREGTTKRRIDLTTELKTLIQPAEQHAH